MSPLTQAIILAAAAAALLPIVTRVLCRALGVEPPVSKETNFEVVPHESGPMLSVTEDTVRVPTGDGLSSYEREETSETANFCLGGSRAGETLAVPARHLVFDGGATLRLIEHRWPRWWQRALAPNRRNGSRYYACPRVWFIDLTRGVASQLDMEKVSAPS
jgi:hypothetical protein